MERNQLNLNAPLLSVRRSSSTLGSTDKVNKKRIEKSLPQRQRSLSFYKSDFETGEVTKPAAVPFTWEHIPGRAKGGNKLESQSQSESPVETSSTPRLQSGRTPSDTPKLLSGEIVRDQNPCQPQIEASPFNDIAALSDNLNEGANAEGQRDSESESDEYSDALDKLSQTETLSMNCSASGLSSGYGGSNAKPCKTISADTQTRDFMMNRFLPAAKAMTLDPPHQYVSKKQPVAPEQQPRLVKKVVSAQRRPLIEQHRSSIVPNHSRFVEDAESEDEDVQYDTPVKPSVKACGLFSRFCLKNSLCILNPVPAMKTRTQSPRTSAKEVNRMARTAYSGPLTQIADKNAGGAVYNKKIDLMTRSHELYKVTNKRTGDSHKLISYSGNLQMRRGPSPCRGLIREGISPYQNAAPQPPSHGGVNSLGVTNDIENVEAIKGYSNLQKESFHRKYKEVSGSTTPTLEKTLYINCVNTVELPVVESISSSADFDSTVDSRRMEETDVTESFDHNIGCVNIFYEGSLSKTSGSVDTDTPSSSARMSTLRSQLDRMDSLTIDRVQNQQLRSSDCSRLHIVKADDQGCPNNVNSSLSPLPPPLPKSPSESWLWHTLPSIPVQRPFSRSSLGAQIYSEKQYANASAVATKWETIVKTSNMHHDYVRYSEELVPRVSQHSKT